jgi:hypothetical protein
MMDVFDKCRSLWRIKSCMQYSQFNSKHITRKTTFSLALATKQMYKRPWPGLNLHTLGAG